MGTVIELTAARVAEAAASVARGLMLQAYGDLCLWTARTHTLCFAQGARLVECGQFGALYEFRDGSRLAVGEGQVVEVRG